jgi:hypothetical protein
MAVRDHADPDLKPGDETEDGPEEQGESPGHAARSHARQFAAGIGETSKECSEW